MTAVLPGAPAKTRVTWVRVEDGFHVASRAGEFVGFAERTSDGHVVGFDGRSTPVGRYESLEAAQRAVENAPAAASTGRNTVRDELLQGAATVTGLVAIGTLALAAIAITAI